MRGQRVPIGLKAAATIFTFTSILTTFVAPAWAAKLKILHSFSGEQGHQPEGVVFGADGNLYGVTVFGGGPENSGIGTVFELTQTVGGAWVETKIHIFHGGAGDYPNQGTLFDSSGNIYGTMQLGPHGTGLVYKLSPDANGIWHETGVHDFSLREGLYPESPLIRDGAGNIYSTAWGGGAYRLGTVFELSPTAGGGWTETTIHSFAGADGAVDKSGLIFDGAGNLYGTTVCGGTSAAAAIQEPAPANPGVEPDCRGASGAGTVWELTPESDGSWTETTLYNFAGGTDGANPVEPGGLIFDSAGNLYGTTLNGGLHGAGTVFELSPISGGGWTEKVLHSFDGTHGSYPYASLALDGAGNLYGEAQSGGENNEGVVFELTPRAGADWKYTLLHNFSGPDGNEPRYGLTLDAAGNLYGTTDAGGAYNNGTVFEIIP